MGGDEEMNQDLLDNLSTYLLLSPYPPCIEFSLYKPESVSYTDSVNSKIN